MYDNSSRTNACRQLACLARLLEPLIPRIVREELAHVAVRWPDVFYLPKDSTLRDDLVDILDRKQHGDISLLSHAEVWGE